VDNIVIQEYFIDETVSLSVNYSDLFINAERIDNIFIDRDNFYFEEDSLYVVYEQGAYEILQVLDGRIVVNEPLFEELDLIVLEEPMAHFIMALEQICSSRYRVDDIIQGLVRYSPRISTVIYNLGT
jgi:hypothetical protein